MIIHLTNYSINKINLNFQQNKAVIADSVGHKRSLRYTLKFLNKSEGQDTEKLMREIKDIIIKTLIGG